MTKKPTRKTSRKSPQHQAMLNLIRAVHKLSEQVQEMRGQQRDLRRGVDQLRVDIQHRMPMPATPMTDEEFGKVYPDLLVRDKAVKDCLSGGGRLTPASITPLRHDAPIGVPSADGDTDSEVLATSQLYAQTAALEAAEQHISEQMRQT